MIILILIRFASYGESDVERILQTEGMLKSRPKIEAIINNASAFKDIQDEFGSFCNYIWAFTDHKTIIYDNHPNGPGCQLRMVCLLVLVKTLKKRGFKFVGPVTIYSHLQASGLINDHGKDCPCFDEINANADIIRLPADGEN